MAASLARPAPVRPLARLAAELPFSLDDSDAAAGAFAAGRAGDAVARRHADLWAYAWMVRYVTRKFLTERVGTPSDVDAVQSRAMDGIVQAAERVTDPARFPAYVSVVCKNALLTHRARRRVSVEADDMTLEAEPEDAHAGLDGAAIRRDVAAAVEALPAGIRTVAQMRFLDGAAFEDISEATGHPLPTVRAYASKATARLRTVPSLRSHFYDDVLPPGSDGGAE